MLPVALLLLAACLVPLTFAAFSAGTGGQTGVLSSGTVLLSDDDSGSALFSAGSLQPGSSGSQCIAVTYGGTLPAQVKLFIKPGDLTGTGLARYLTITVTEGSGGGFGPCSTAFTPITPASYTGTLLNLANTSDSWTSGVGSFSPTGAGQTRVYRVAYTLTAGASAQGLNSQVQLTWEARSN